MNHGKLVFAQLIDFVPIKKFRLCVKRYGGDHRVRNFTCWDQFLCMAFAQLTYRESLRDIEVCLRTKSKKLYHLGIRGTVARTTLARANDRRDWRIYHDFAMVLIEQARALYSQDPLSVRLKRAVYALDSTTIDLCLSLFPWAKFRSTKAAVKLHTLIDLRGNIPSVIVISRGNMHDVNILDDLVFEAWAIYIMDRAYLDYARLYRITQAAAVFVTRAKKNTQFRRIHSHKVTHTLSQGQAKHRYHRRSNHNAYRCYIVRRLSRKASANRLPRSCNEQATCISDQQLFARSKNDRRSL